MDKEIERLLSEDEAEKLRRIFDMPIETDEDLLELAKLVEDESDETDLVIDYDFDFGTGD